VAHRAVDLEQLVAASDVAVTLGVLVVGNRRAGAQRSDVRGERGDLLGVELDLVAAGGLNGRAGERHTAGADLEVDGCGAHAGQAGALFAALGVATVAGGAVGQEQLLAGSRLISGSHSGLGRFGGQEGVEPSGDDEPQQQDEQNGGRMAAPGG